MAKKISAILDTETMPLHHFTEKAYLDYSMYVILDRALPHIGDGLKPVQRRIIYAMSELGLKETAKYKKSARTVGDVLGKFHPHGDSACYEAMVLMAQPFSYRYPFVDGQGNWGSPDDPKSFAAMRYTESRLSGYANLLLSEVDQGTVDFVPNFDGTLEEPSLLPARVPNVLLNGGTGIAVGMATDIPPHNLREVVSACIHLLDNPEATLKDICKHIKGPDFCTAAEIITPKKDILEVYSTGYGSVRMRAVYKKEKDEIIITALPHHVSGAKVLEQIATQMQAKKLPMVEDLRDESDHENPTRLVIIPRSNRVDVEALMSHLFATTELESSYRINFNIIGLDGKPRVKNLMTLLNEWLEFRKSTVTKRLNFRLDKVEARLHILDGLLIAFLNIDEVIKIIREKEHPKLELIKRFKLTEIQAEAILELKLRHLAKLEEMQIKGEQKELAQERDFLKKTLGSPKLLNELIKSELTADAEKYGDKRRSPMIEREEAAAIKAEDILPSEAITVILSEKGWVRAAKGHDVDIGKFDYRAGDSFLMSVQGKSNQVVYFFDSSGRTYTLPAHTLPSARGHGEPLTSRLELPPGATIVSAIMGESTQKILMASSAGYGFVTNLEELFVKNKTGKATLNPPEGSKALAPQMISNTKKDRIATVTSAGKLLVIPVSELPELNKGKGNKIIGIAAGESVVGCAIVPEGEALTLYAGKRSLTLSPKDITHFVGERGRRGNNLPKGLSRVDRIEATKKT